MAVIKLSTDRNSYSLCDTVCLRLFLVKLGNKENVWYNNSLYKVDLKLNFLIFLKLLFLSACFFNSMHILLKKIVLDFA